MNEPQCSAAVATLVRRRSSCRALAVVALSCAPAAATAQSREVTLWTARAFATVLAEVGAQFERANNVRLRVATGLPMDFTRRAASGERYDVVISTTATIDDWITAGRLKADSRRELSRSGIGVLVRAGAPKPDISSVDAFKRTLLDAKSIAFLPVGSGLHMVSVLERLGIADAVRPKVTRPESDVVAQLVADGTVELGIVVITQILTTPGVELVGPLPAELQSYIVFAGAVATNAAAPDAAARLLDFLTGPQAAPVVRAQGMEPPAVNWWAEDSARIAFVTAHGRSYTGPQTVVWAPNDSLDAQWLAAFADSLARSHAQLVSVIGGPYPWQRLGAKPVTFYLSPGRFVSHASGTGAVFISLARVRSGSAPYLHEAAHELLAPLPPFWDDEYPDSAAGARAMERFPVWLSEGLADYVAQVTAAKTGFREGDVFEIGGLGRADSTCAARLRASARRDEIIAKVGGGGRLEALFTAERAQVAPTFYACSQSFTKYLVDRVGLPKVVALFPAIGPGTWRSDLEAAARQPLDTLRRTWLTAIGYAGPHD